MLCICTQHAWPLSGAEPFSFTACTCLGQGGKCLCFVYPIASTACGSPFRQQRLHVSLAATYCQCTPLIWKSFTMLSRFFTAGSPLCIIHGPTDMRGRGGTICFNLLNEQGALMSVTQISGLAETAGIMIRAGCMCNPHGAWHALSAFNVQQLRGWDPDLLPGKAPTDQASSNRNMQTSFTFPSVSRAAHGGGSAALSSAVHDTLPSP